MTGRRRGRGGGEEEEGRRGWGGGGGDEGMGMGIELCCYLSFFCVGKEEPFQTQEVSDEYLLIKLLLFLLLFPLIFPLFSFFFLSGSAGASPVLLVN